MTLVTTTPFPSSAEEGSRTAQFILKNLRQNLENP